MFGVWGVDVWRGGSLELGKFGIGGMECAWELEGQSIWFECLEVWSEVWGLKVVFRHVWGSNLETELGQSAKVRGGCLE